MRLIFLGLCLLTATRLIGATATDIGAAVGQRYEQAEAAQVGALAGVDGWYFLAAELRSYSRGPFWGADAAKASRAAKDQDPLAVIVAFDRMVKAAGIALIVVPVPGKVAIHPDGLDPALKSGERWDGAQAAFNAALTKEGVQVIDLVP
ncbi:MAG: hypothetical protein H0W72_02020, partial [Planctomycetes bacterium]|nr:hypothetical protein [Planctomycetota bacterium]